jgi:hypothetical protein
MNTELPGGVAGAPSLTENRAPRQGRGRTGVVLALVIATATGAFAAVTELVLHRWLHLYSSSIAGSAWLFFGMYWSVTSVRRLRGSAPNRKVGDGPAAWSGNRILGAYQSTLLRAASLAFVVIVLAGLVDRFWRS